MGGFFGAISRKNCKYDVFFGTDDHSHLGTKRGGMAFYDEEKGFQRQIHNIENTPFRTKFEGDLNKLDGTAGIGCISDNDPQPLLVRSHLGMFAIANVGIINNAEKIVEETGYRALADEPADSVFCAKGAGFTVAWDKVRDFAHLNSEANP